LFCHDLSKAVDAFECLCNEAQKDPALRARLEDSYRRIIGLKSRCLKSFTGVAEGIGFRLEELNHQAIVDQVHGSL
jgi:hypothetical protein